MSASKRAKEEKKFKKQLDAVWSGIVKKRDKRCLWCGGSKNLAADHIFSRRRNSTRWVIENGIALCAGCHIFKKRYNPMIWALMVLNNRSMETIQALLKQHQGDEKTDLTQVKHYLETAGETLQ